METDRRFEAEEIQLKRAIEKMEMANWVHGLAPWSVIAHFTWRDKIFRMRDGTAKPCGVKSETARRYFEKFMSKEFPRLSYFYAVEENPSRDGHHIHSLFADTRNLYRKEMWDLWFKKFGRNKIEPVTSVADVVSYVSKYVVKAGVWWNVSLQWHHRQRITASPLLESAVLCV
jgi:hypothetical protein